ncbi:MAG TPA: 2-amino-4-hydroxy-6-hydroxymethyldihydropteridine diphosphokinase [Terriglobales bacterium]|nr:2-amino-4-hydroxy-6-hydroxymethyldihydropteridine diphosphokinase [Terriglobales bacterium]
MGHADLGVRIRIGGRATFLLASGGEKLETTSTVQEVVYLSLGSNVGDRSANLAAAIASLRSLGEVTSVSSLYETEPVGFTAQPWFLNCAVKLMTDKTPKQLLADILDLEQKMGRVRAQKNGPRIIDVDILLFGESIVETKGLTVPHPAMHQRRFVLEPLAEIAPELRHPVLNRTIRQLRDALPPGQAVRKLAKA